LYQAASCPDEVNYNVHETLALNNWIKTQAIKINGNKNNKSLKENSITKELEIIVFIIIVFYNAIENLLLVCANQHSIFFLFIY